MSYYAGRDRATSSRHIDTGHRRCANVVTVTSAASPTPATAGSNPTGLTAALAAIVGEAHVLVDAELRSAHETDWTGRFHGSTPAVVRPGSLDEVAAIVALCRSLGVGVVPQGGNTGLVGGSVPRRGEVIIDVRRFDTIEQIDPLARQVTVGAGVTLAELQRAAAEHGLRYAVDFGARDTATVGGSIATNAGGNNFLRFGGTRAQLVGIEATLGTGQVVQRLAGLAKDNTGYDLAGLLCGSEGTLGVITRARLQLVAQHACRVTALIGFADLATAIDAVLSVRGRVGSLEAAEIMLDDGVQMVCRSFGLAMPFTRQWPVYVLLEAADDHDPSEVMAVALESLAGSGAGDVAVAGATGDGAARRAALWRYREGHTLALRTLGPTIKLDVTVPLAAIADFMTELPPLVAQHHPQVSTWLFGHIGDGNLHVNLTGHDGADAVVAHDLERIVLSKVVAVGGCISAEHGIGVAKVEWLSLDRSHGEIEAMRAIKRALDPDGVLNPGVLFSSERPISTNDRETPV